MMKKLLSIALALAMLLTGAAAAAEASAVAVFSDPVLTMSQGGQSYIVDMTGLHATLTSGLAGGVPTIRLDVDHDGKKLMGGVLQISNGAMLFELDGMAHTYKIPMNANGMEATAQMGYNQMFANLDKVYNAKIPAFPGVAIPKLTLPDAVLSVISNGSVTTNADGSKSCAIDMDYNQVYDLLEWFLKQANTSAPKAQLSQALSILSMLRLSQIGVNVKGSIVDSGDRLEINADFYLVYNGQADSAPSAGLRFASMENDDLLTVGEYRNGAWQTVVALELVSEPEAAMMTLSLEAEDGTSFSLGLYPEEGMQMIVFDMNAGGDAFSLYYSYGQRDDTDCVYLGMESEDGSGSNFGFETVADGSGGHEGTFTWTGSFGGVEYAIASDFILTAPPAASYDANLTGVTDAYGAIDVTQLNEAGYQALAADADQAIADFTSYLNGLTMQPLT